MTEKQWIIFQGICLAGVIVACLAMLIFTVQLALL